VLDISLKEVGNEKGPLSYQMQMFCDFRNRQEEHHNGGRGNVEARIGKSDSSIVFSQYIEYFGLRYISDTVTAEFLIMLPVDVVTASKCSLGLLNSMPARHTIKIPVLPRVNVTQRYRTKIHTVSVPVPTSL
jgi:hypothetical protein